MVPGRERGRRVAQLAAANEDSATVFCLRGIRHQRRSRGLRLGDPPPPGTGTSVSVVAASTHAHTASKPRRIWRVRRDVSDSDMAGLLGARIEDADLFTSVNISCVVWW